MKDYDNEWHFIYNRLKPSISDDEMRKLRMRYDKIPNFKANENIECMWRFWWYVTPIYKM